ncbi:dihydrofolate reductase family protein [Virgibacillus kimchii]
MGKVVFDISVSLDGFIAGLNDSSDNPIGDGGKQLHEWIYKLASWRKQHGLTGGEKNRNDDILQGLAANTGAIIMGKRMFNSGADYWDEKPPFHMPVFVLTHEKRAMQVKEGGTTFHFVNDGVKDAFEQAKETAGNKDISIAGGASVIHQFLNAGLIDEFQLHVVPIFLGSGIRLFKSMNAQLKIEKISVLDSPEVTHMKYRLRKQ